MNPIALPSILLVAFGGALGCMARYIGILGASRLHLGIFPIGTMLVNILGSFLIGYLMARSPGDSVRLLLITGMLGGFTTFSAFSWDALQLMQRGQMAYAVFYIGCSVLLSLAAVWLGFALAK